MTQENGRNMIPKGTLTAIQTPSGFVAIQPGQVSDLLHCIDKAEVRAAMMSRLYSKDEYLAYCRGLLIGFFAGLNGVGFDADQIIALCKRYAPKDYDPEAIPEPFRQGWEKCQEQPGE